MKKRHFFYLAILFAAGLMASCAKDEETPTPSDLPMGEAYITDSSYVNSSRMKVYNFVYPSVDPYGNPIMLSGTITMGDGVSRQTPAKGMLLYNHFTVYRADQCPSRGDLEIQGMATGLPLIAVSADYYGFGVTEHHHQAYCISSTNAQASIDALLGARKILAQMGYHWDDVLFNIGYSQGGQTTMGVVRLVAEKYPDIDITYSFAGAGSYDIPETYRQFHSATIAGMPALRRRLPRAGGARRPRRAAAPVQRRARLRVEGEIDAMVGSLSIADFVTPTMLDTNSALSRRFMQAFDSDNLCHGWTPRGDERIMLFHSTKDITVPVANTQNLYNFLTSHGVQGVDLQIHDIDAMGNTPAHENAALMFGFLALGKVTEILGINS